MSELRMGIGQVDFTPETGLPMMGNFRDDYAATGVHDPLCCRALVLTNEAGMKLAVLGLDLCMLPREKVALMRGWIEEDTGIPADHVLIACTHTHSGPATLGLYGMPPAPDDRIDAFLRQAVRAAADAAAHIAPGTLAFGASREERLGFNRRLRGRDGQMHMNWEQIEPEEIAGTLGPVDPDLAVLTVRQDGELGAALVNFALHPAVLDYANSLYSADYPGYLSEALSRLMGTQLTTLFFNGCCGNINHIDYTDPTAPRRGYQAVQRIGYMLAVATKEAIDRAVPVKGCELGVARDRVALKRYTFEAETIGWAREVLQREPGPTSGAADGLPEQMQAAIWLDMHAVQGQDDEVEVMALRIGDAGIVGLPGEVFCEFGLAIKERSPAPHTLVLELANDAVGYIPTCEAYTQGGYEPTPGSTRYAPGAGERLTEAAVRLLGQLFP